jgi:hypothetical protein
MAAIIAAAGGRVTIIEMTLQHEQARRDFVRKHRPDSNFLISTALPAGGLQ